MNKYQALKSMLNDVKSIVVFTGAGISVPSGIPDFRSESGLYNQNSNMQINPEEILSHSFYLNHTDQFFDFYKKKMIYPNAKPNNAHKFISSLERQNKNVIVITQNIDGLHQEAGSKVVYELHGNIHRNYCSKCGRSFGYQYILNSNEIPYCDKCGEIIKPDVVLYEESLNEDIITRSISAIMTCELLLVIGTSLNVYPAAGFVRYFKGKYLVVINKDKTNIDNQCDLVINEDIVEVIKNLQ